METIPFPPGQTQSQSGPAGRMEACATRPSRVTEMTEIPQQIHPGPSEPQGSTQAAEKSATRFVSRITGSESEGRTVSLRSERKSLKKVLPTLQTGGDAADNIFIVSLQIEETKRSRKENASPAPFPHFCPLDPVCLHPCAYASPALPAMSVKPEEIRNGPVPLQPVPGIRSAPT